MRTTVLALLVLTAAAGAQAETFCSCATDSGTAGTFKNAECQNTLGVPRVAAVSWCDDFEAAGYTAQTGANSWTAACTTGGVSARGGGSLWAQRYGGTSAGCGWSHGTTFSVGTSPCDLRVNDGSPCGGGNCPCGDECEPAGWLTGDPLEAGNSACVGILRANDIDDLFPAATEPSAPLAGSNSLVEIVQTGQTNGLWQNGSASFNTHTFAISKIVAFPSDIASSGILDWPWKGDQCGADNHCTDTWLGALNGYSTNIFPFAGTSIYTLDNCSAARSGATYVVGSISNVSCNGSQFRVEGVTNYNRSTDWPYGQAGLVQVFYRAYGTSSTEMRVMFTPLGGSRLTLLHITGLNTTGASTPSPYNPNAYANANQGGGETPTSRDTGRIMDNLLIQSWTSGTAPADVLAVMPTPSEMQFGEAPPPSEPTYAPVFAE